jgi:PAS domain S-box-containing protein
MLPELAVALLGHSSDTEPWAALLGHPSWRITHAGMGGIPGEAHLLIAVVPPAEMQAAVRELAAVADPPPMALFTGRPHPLMQMLAALLQAKRDWEGAFDAIVDAVALLDAQGVVRRANLVLARELGVPIHELVGQPIRSLLGELDGDDVLALSLRDGRPRTAEVRYGRLEGVRQVTTSPLPGDGDAAGMVAIFKDVTALREQHARALQASRLADIGQLAAGIAHEINTPLASIALRAEALLRRASGPAVAGVREFETFPRYLKTIEEDVFRCKRIISALLEFSRSHPPEARDTDLNELCERTADLLRHEARQRGIELALRLDPNLPRLRADEGQLGQAFVALLMNALDASASGGRVVIETAREDDGIRITIADNGSGIEPEHLDKIFSPFFSTKPIGKGTGLGLAVSHGIVTAHGGRFDVASVPGEGTRMSVLLPLAGPSS